MADSTSDGKAGSSCTDCETPPKCFHQYTIKDSAGKAILDIPLIQNGKVSLIPIIQSTKEATYAFELKGKCVNGKEQCPTTCIPNQEYLYGTDTKKDILSYSDEYNWSNMTLLRWLKEFMVFDITKLETRRQVLPIVECKGLVHVTTLVIYPTYKMTIKFAYGKEVNSSDFENKKQRARDYSRDELDKIKRDTGKSFTQLNRTLVKQNTSNGLEAEVEIGEFKEKVALTLSESECYSDDNPIFKITSIVNKISSSLMSKGGSVGPVRNIQLFGPNFEISGVKELKLGDNNNIYFELSANIGLAPFLGIKVVIDLIAVALALIPAAGAGVSKGWTELRKAMDKAKENLNSSGNGAYIAVGIDLVLTGEIGNCSVTIYTDANKKVKGKGEGGGELKAEVIGYLEGEANIWFITGALEASASFETSIGCSLVVDDQGAGAKWQHGGAKVTFKAELKAGTKTKRNMISYETTPLELVFAEPYESDPSYFMKFV